MSRAAYMGEPAVGGVDGARGAWVVALQQASTWRLERCEDFASVVALADREGLVQVGVDMPIGLPSAGARTADTEARAVLGVRRSSLFPTPVAAALHAASYEEALAASRAASGKGMSKQAFHLLPMIRQVRDAVGPGQRGRFFESHPETTFTVLAGEPLPTKKSAAGVGRRLALLRSYCTDLDDVLASAPAGLAVDDALDAMAAAVSARRVVDGAARIFGAGAGVDAAGYSLRILA